jgi:hypothetical protein
MRGEKRHKLREGEWEGGRVGGGRERGKREGEGEEGGRGGGGRGRGRREGGRVHMRRPEDIQ